MNPRIWSCVRIAILSAMLLTMIAQSMMAQSQNVSGTVVDASGGMIPDAAVKITDVAKGGTARQTSTDNSGRFQAMNIQPGHYLVSIEKTGFKKTELPLTLDVNSKVDLGQIKLEVGNVSDSVSVEADTTPMITNAAFKQMG